MALQDLLQKDPRDEETKKFLSQFRNQSSGKYNIDNYSYPLEIGGLPDLQHYVSFFINVRGKSKFNQQTVINGTTQELLNDVKVGTGQNRIDPDKVANSGAATTAAGAAAGAAAGGAAGILSGLTSSGSAKEKAASIAKATKSAAVGAAAGAVTVQALKKLGVLQPDTLKRIKDVITLHIQEKPTTSYSVKYQDKDLGSLGGILAGGSSAVDTSQTALSSIAKEVTAAAVTGVINTVGGTLGGGAGRLLELGTKQKLNPFREQFFESVDYRTFNFRHTFMPKSQAEALNVRRILNLFKFHMHPELSQTGLFYIYPSEFEIRYFYRDRENTYFDKISACALEDMSVDYGGDIFSTFEDGNPVEVNLTLKFKELEILTKERIAQGY